MKFDVEIPALNGTARVEIRTAQEGDSWAAYLSLVYDRALSDTCLLLGRRGIPHRFTGATESAAQETAKKYLEKNYRVVRMLW